MSGSAAPPPRVSPERNITWLHVRAGEGVGQDYGTALKWFRFAADQGLVIAQSALGFMYCHGNGVTQNYTEALKWYRKAADEGEAGRSLRSAPCTMTARECRRTPPRREVVSQGRRAGRGQGAVRPRDRRSRGNGVPQDYVQAHVWFSLAALLASEKETTTERRRRAISSRRRCNRASPRGGKAGA